MNRLPWAILAVTATIAAVGVLGVLLADYVP